MADWPFPYPQNTGNYRAVPDLRTYEPWTPSPRRPWIELDDVSGAKLVVQTPEPPSHSCCTCSKEVPKAVPERTKRKRFAFFRSKKSVADFDVKASNGVACHLHTLRREPPDFTDWKAYGYWARPWVNDTYVDNAAGTMSISCEHVDIDRLWNSIRDPDGHLHPDEWIPGLEHPSLPPRPKQWPPPTPELPPPPPWECILNPFLVHLPLGRPRLYWDISHGSTSIVWGQTEDNQSIPMLDPDKAQPATYPFLTEMHVSGLADDSGPSFPWPFTVKNDYGITCHDVISAIFHNFQQPVYKEEEASWSMLRRRQAAYAFHVRIHSPNTEYPLRTPGEREGLRRIDYLGDRFMFRGMESSPRRDGTWIIFFGPP